MGVFNQAAEFLDLVDESPGVQLNHVVVVVEIRQIPELVSIPGCRNKSRREASLDSWDTRERAPGFAADDSNEWLFQIGELDALAVGFSGNMDRIHILDAAILASHTFGRRDVIDSTGAGQTPQIDRVLGCVDSARGGGGHHKTEDCQDLSHVHVKTPPPQPMYPTRLGVDENESTFALARQVV